MRTIQPENRFVPRKSNLFLLARRPGVFARAYWLPAVLLLAGAAADAATTMNNLYRFGPEAEVHLVQRLVVHLMGVTAGVPVAKTIQLFFVVLVAAWWRPWCAAILSACGVLYGLAAVSNHFHLL